MQALLALDATLAEWLNTAARSSRVTRTLMAVAARWLAGIEVLLMVVLALAGRPRLAARMLVSVGLIYAASEIWGGVWPRKRPFASSGQRIEALLPHASGRSFPSRHVASGLAMSLLGRRGHPLLGKAMMGVAVLLGVSRVAAGVHYPSDVLAGAGLGIVAYTVDSVATHIMRNYSANRTRF